MVKIQKTLILTTVLFFFSPCFASSIFCSPFVDTHNLSKIDWFQMKPRQRWPNDARVEVSAKEFVNFIWGTSGE